MAYLLPYRGIKAAPAGVRQGKIARILMLFSKHWKKQQIRTAAELPLFQIRKCRRIRCQSKERPRSRACPAGKLPRRQNPRRSGKQRHPCTGILVQKRRSAPLDKAAAHDCDQIVRAGLLPRLFHMVNMSRVKRVVFYDDACCFQSDKYLHVHGFLTF